MLSNIVATNQLPANSTTLWRWFYFKTLRIVCCFCRWEQCNCNAIVFVSHAHSCIWLDGVVAMGFGYDLKLFVVERVSNYNKSSLQTSNKIPPHTPQIRVHHHVLSAENILAFDWLLVRLNSDLENSHVGNLRAYVRRFANYPFHLIVPP